VFTQSDIVSEEIPTVEELKARGTVILDILHPDEHLEAMCSLYLITQDVGNDILRFHELWATWTESFERVLGIAQRVRG
jgi:hypothetical protein